VGFKPTIPVFELAKTVHALDRTATVIGEAKDRVKRKFLMNVTGHTLNDNIKKGVIRNELNIFDLNIGIQNNGLNWIRHVERMEPERIPKQFVDCTTRGTRFIGRRFL
jgi:hypothetical protein